MNFTSENVTRALTYDIDRYEHTLARYLSGDLDPDEFRIFRLGYGIYGQRQGGDQQMVRVKLPGGTILPDHFEALATASTKYSRGFGHITTRQNIQFHFVALEDTPKILRELAQVGLTSREACGDTVRNITGCPYAGYCPSEVLDITPWVQETFSTLLRHPYGQRLPRKFKINFSGCKIDCGQASFNDVGVVACTRPSPDREDELGFKVFLGGGLGANPKPAIVLEDFTPADQLLATIEAALRTFDHYGNRENKVRARMKWLVESLGSDELRSRVLKERKYLIASASYPQLSNYPDLVNTLVQNSVSKTPVSLSRRPGKARPSGGDSPFEVWRYYNVLASRQNTHTSEPTNKFLVNVTVPLGDLTSRQFSGLGKIVRTYELVAKTTNRQNIVLMDLEESQLESLYQELDDLNLGNPGTDVASDVVSCPGAETCNLGITQSRELARAITLELSKQGLEDTEGIKINISGCTNSCGQHHYSDIGLSGAERRAHSRQAPGYQLYLGAHLGDDQVTFAKKTLRLPAKNTPEAVGRLVSWYREESRDGEDFSSWVDRRGGSKVLAKQLEDLDVFPPPETNPDYYMDYGESISYAAVVGEGECAGS